MRKLNSGFCLPGRQSTVANSDQAAVSKLRVVAFGLWTSPGDSEEVAAALYQALRNRIERALSGLAYMRFGDVFSKFHPSQSEELLRKGQPTVEFIFAATDEGIFVHALVSAKHVRALSNGDLERTLKQSSKNTGCGLPGRERRSLLQSQVSKALSYSATVDEASISNILVLSGFSIPKLVLQIVTVDAIFKVTSSSLNELVILKETACTVYNKARRISQGPSSDAVQSSSLSCRSHTVLTQMPSTTLGTWKDCVGSRITGHSLPREGEIDASLRTGGWDSSWQTRSGAVSCDPNRIGDIFPQDETRYMFEPLFILSEPGSLERALSPLAFGNLSLESSKPLSDDSSGGYVQNASLGGNADSGSGSQDGFEPDKTPSLHRCYGWTEDWRWLLSIWTDSRGELLDSHIFPFGGISSRQDTKGLECLFVQVLQQGCQILQTCSSDTSAAKPRDFVIARIGSFYELEYQEWQKAIISVGGSEVKKWHLQLRRSLSDGMSASSNGHSMQQQEMSMIQERPLPSSPGPLYDSSH